MFNAQLIMSINTYFLNLLQQKTMEYQYRMLCPAPYSMESIQFKLSQTHLSNCAIVSPSKRPDSLTYTVSMETIQVPDSPLKFISTDLLQVPESNQMHFNRKSLLTYNDKYDICSQHPIISIKLQQLSHLDINLKKDDALCCQIKMHQGDEHKTDTLTTAVQKDNMFLKKSVLKIHNIEFHNQIQQSTKALTFNINIQNKRRKSPRMGKILTNIHNQIKEQNKAISRTNSKSSRKAFEKNRGSSPIIISKNQEQSRKAYQSLHNDLIKQKESINVFKTETNQNDDNSFSFKDSLFAIQNSSSGIVASPEIKRRKSNYLDGKITIKRCDNKNEIYMSQRPMQNFIGEKKKGVKYNYLQKSRGISIRQRIRSSLATNKLREVQPYNYLPHQNSLIYQKKYSKKQFQNHNSNNIIMVNKNNNENPCQKFLDVIAKKINLTDRNELKKEKKERETKNKSIQDYVNNSANAYKIPLNNNYMSANKIQYQDQLFNEQLDLDRKIFNDKKAKDKKRNKENYYKKFSKFEI